MLSIMPPTEVSFGGSIFRYVLFGQVDGVFWLEQTPGLSDQASPLACFLCTLPLPPCPWRRVDRCFRYFDLLPAKPFLPLLRTCENEPSQFLGFEWCSIAAETTFLEEEMRTCLVGLAESYGKESRGNKSLCFIALSRKEQRSSSDHPTNFVGLPDFHFLQLFPSVAK